MDEYHVRFGTLIVNEARKYIGMEEVRGNLSFKDPILLRLMSGTGWRAGEAWCAYFAYGVWANTFAQYNSTIIPFVRVHFSASAVKTYNLNKGDNFMPITMNPREGYLVVWQKYNTGIAHWSGHMGIVSKVESNAFFSIEGNTNNNPNEREGYQVCEKKHTLEFRKKDGLRLLGFVSFPDVYYNFNRYEN